MVFEVLLARTTDDDPDRLFPTRGPAKDTSLLERRDGAITINDAPAVAAARDLGMVGIAAGPCDGAKLAAIRTVTHGTAPDAAEFLGLGADCVVVLLVPEGLEAS